jgi:AcrR family transcriptional regulator
MRKNPHTVPQATVATSDKLLDAAERLFAEHGYAAVGMRALAEEARVNLNAATYHFGTKEKLYIETFMRRFRSVSAGRLDLLRQAQAKARGRGVGVETIVECLMRPPFQAVLDHPHFPALLARNLFLPPSFLREILEAELQPSLEPFVQALSQALPQLPPPLLMVRLMFSGGSLLMFAAHQGGAGRRELSHPTFAEVIFKELVRFVSIKLRAKPTVSTSDMPPLPLPLGTTRV